MCMSVSVCVCASGVCERGCDNYLTEGGEEVERRERRWRGEREEVEREESRWRGVSTSNRGEQRREEERRLHKMR